MMWSYLFPHARCQVTLGERRLNVDLARDRVVAAGDFGLGAYAATGFQIEAAAAQVQAAEIALNGVREEARVGQRMMLNAPNAQQGLLTALLGAGDSPA